ncbi:hypothetical protein Va1_043 [Vibrio phage Va1]|nr:hypothetical protein Va1_043 [Vibrio phage Va1]
MKIQELKRLVLVNKKVNKERSQALAAVLKQVESKTVGVKYDEKDEEKIVLGSFKKELKEQLQSKDMGAPYSKEVISLCEQVIEELSPKTLSKEQTEIEVRKFVSEKPDAKMGQVMGYLKQTFGDTIDMQLAQKVVKSVLE